VVLEGDSVLTSAQRERLWQLFQTPVYGILMAGDGRIAGYECEAQDGFHAAVRPKTDEEAVCECGRKGPMRELVSAQPSIARRRLPKAAGAEA
jgi:hypothetical protein